MSRVQLQPTPGLSAEEVRLVRAYRTMNDRARHENLELLESDAKDRPRRAAPALKLVSGGAS